MREFSALVAGLLLLAATPPVRASARLAVPEERALEQPLRIVLSPGNPFAVDFSATNQCIQSIFPGDRSRYVYRTEVPLDAGCATILNLLQIQPIRFPGATHTSQPSLQVVTRETLPDGNSRKRLYTLIVDFGRSSHRTLAVVPAAARLHSAAIAPQVFRTARGFNANLFAFESGLDAALSQGLTAPDDPVVRKVREFLVLLHNDSTLTVEAAAERMGLSLDFLNSLAELGLKARARQQLEEPAEAAGAELLRLEAAGETE